MTDVLDTTVGYLNLICGPMFAGKTSRLQEIYFSYQKQNIPVLVINYAEDQLRYEGHTMLTSHDNVQNPCITAYGLNDVIHLSNDVCAKQISLEQFLSTPVILINEGQFFPDCVSWVTLAVEKYNKRVYIAGLDGDFKKQPFGEENWLDLMSLCDQVTKLYAICHGCQEKNALFSHRLSCEQSQKVIGVNNYVPLCRKCFNSKQFQLK